MTILSFTLQLILLAVTLGIIVRFSWVIGKRKFMKVHPVMHNKCHTDNLRVETTHGNLEPQV
jgi:hypothetical protein